MSALISRIDLYLHGHPAGVEVTVGLVVVMIAAIVYLAPLAFRHRQAVRRMAAITGSARDAVIIMDPDSRITFWNDAAAGIFGWSAGEALGQAVHPLLAPGRYHEAFGKAFPRFGRSGEGAAVGKTVELWALRKDGSEFPVEMSLAGFRSRGGWSALAIVRDVSARKHLEQSLRDTQERFELAVLGSRSGLWDWPDVKVDAQWWSPRFYEMLGYQPGEIPASYTAFGELLHPEDREKTLQAEQAHLDSNAPYDAEYRLRCKTGKYRWFAARGLAVRDEQGRPRRMAGSLEDISERRKYEDSLQVSEERYRSLVENLGEGLAVMDLEERLMFANPVAYAIFGEPPGSLQGQDLTVFFDEANRSIIAEQTLRRRRGESGAYHLTLRRRDGEKRDLLVTARPRYDEQGQVDGTYSLLRDVTAQRRAEEALQEANRRLELAVEEARRATLAAQAADRTKSEFLANMSHEIRTPMNGVIGMAGLLLDTRLDAEQRDCAQTIVRSADALLGVINDILDFSKIEAGRMELEILDFDLQRTLEDLSDILAVRPLEKGLEYTCLIEPEVPCRLRGDPGRLRQVLTNLVGNAVKFTERGEVSLSVRPEAEEGAKVRLRFEVADSGIGISKEQIDRLFQPFTQADASTTRRFGGTGLGLSIAKQLAELMGGQIGVESEQGKGSTFWFSAVFEKQPPGAEEQTAAAAEDIRGKRVLIVDDNATNRAVLSRQLSSWGCSCAEAAGAGQALTLLREAQGGGAPFQLAILDMLMPGTDGEMLGRQIRADDSLRGVILIMMSSAGSRGDAARLKEIGFSAYLRKPVKQSQLYDCLATVLDRSPAHEAEAAPPPLVTRHSLAEDRKRKLRILLAEDNPTNRKVALALLSRLGFRADAVANGAEAVQALREMHYDLVFMDVQMPEMDGLEATRRIRRPSSKVKDPGVPIIAMTAHAMKGDRERCLEAGMNDYVSKPVAPKELLEAIRRQLGDEPAPQQRPAAAGPRDMKQELFDPGVLMETLGGDRELMQTILRGFLEDFRDKMAGLQGPSAEREPLGRLAHSLKGAAGSIGARRLQEAAVRLEQELGQSGVATPGPALAELAAEFTRLKEHLEAEVLAKEGRE